jgi:DNA-binding transcriptional ArsR family regulator
MEASYGNATTGVPETGLPKQVHPEMSDLWYVLSGPDGARNRARILAELADGPRTASELADEMAVVPSTVRHHLDVLAERGLIEGTGAEYDEAYVLSDRIEENWATVEEIIDATLID